MPHHVTESEPHLPQPTWRRWLGRATLILPVLAFGHVAHKLKALPQPKVLDWTQQANGERFGVPLSTRQEIFADIASHDLEWLQLSKRFPDAWSQHDDYHVYVGRHIKYLAGQYKLKYSQVFLIYDEGLHAGWRDKKGHQPDAGWVQLRPRTE